jgi:hypothetical protein
MLGFFSDPAIFKFFSTTLGKLRESYSYLNESTGFIFAAFLAG